MAQGRVLMVRADEYCPADATLVPTGEILTVSDALDFRSARRIGDVMPGPAGIDNNFVLRKQSGANAILSGPLASLRFTTDQPGLQIYTGQSLSKPFQPFQGVCLEPQYFPNSVNQPNFGSCIHSPDNPYRQRTEINIQQPAN